MVDFPIPVHLTHWKCESGHTHKTKKAAEACRDRLEAIRSFENRREEQKDRRFRREELALELRQSGKTHKEIGQIIGNANDPKMPLTAGRVRQLVSRAERRNHRDEKKGGG